MTIPFPAVAQPEHAPPYFLDMLHISGDRHCRISARLLRHTVDGIMEQQPDGLWKRIDMEYLKENP